MGVNDDRELLRRIGRAPLLTADDERRLMRRAEAGDDAARERMIEANLRLVLYLARRLPADGPSISLMDLVQEGATGLVRAVDRFEWRRGVRFSTYAAWWIRSAMLQALQESGGTVRLSGPAARRASELRRARAAFGGDPAHSALAEHLGWSEDEVRDLDRALARAASLDMTAGEDGGWTLGDTRVEPGEPAEDRLATAELRAPLERALLELPATARRVVELRFGLGETDPLTRREIAKLLGTSPQKVRYAEELALRRLRAQPLLRALGDAA